MNNFQCSYTKILLILNYLKTDRRFLVMTILEELILDSYVFQISKVYIKDSIFLKILNYEKN